MISRELFTALRRRAVVGMAIGIKDYDGRRVYVSLAGSGRQRKFLVGKFIGLDEDAHFLILDLEKEGKTRHKIEMVNLRAVESIIPLGEDEDPQTLLA